MAFGDQSIEQFLTAIAAESVSPASGSAIAVTGSIGAALCEMTCIHLLDRGQSEPDGDELSATREQLSEHRNELLRLAEQDAAVIETVFARSSSAPSQPEIERSVEVPLVIAESCHGVAQLGLSMAERDEREVMTDAETGILLAGTAMHGALSLVEANLDGLADRTHAAEIEDRIAELLDGLAETPFDTPAVDQLEHDQR